MNQKALELVTRDVFLYITKDGVGDEIDAHRAAHRGRRPLAGERGCVQRMRRSDRRASVPLFVTVGSSLGVRRVREQFRPLRSPAGVSAWYNAYDTRDVVAIYPLDADDFPIQPAITNYGKVRNSTDDSRYETSERVRCLHRFAKATRL